MRWRVPLKYGRIYLHNKWNVIEMCIAAFERSCGKLDYISMNWKCSIREYFIKKVMHCATIKADPAPDLFQGGGGGI